MTMRTPEDFKGLISKVEYSEIKNDFGASLGWNSYIYDSNDVVKAGGTADSKDLALRIAYAELIERSTFKKISHDSILKNRFQLTEHPTTCGFAAGFSRQETKMRAICEAIERWCFSEWVDKQKYISTYKPQGFNELTNFFLGSFDSVDFYVQKINLELIEGLNIDQLYFCACLGYKGSGVFLGSRVSNNFIDLFQHAAIEAYRAHIIFKNLETSRRKSNFYTDRIKYWGHNNKNLPHFSDFEKLEFDKPKLALVEEYSESVEYFVYRALCDNFIPWNVGDEKRFVY